MSVITLGSAALFALLAYSTITNSVSVGTLISNGNIGVSPGTSITGFPPGIVSGSTHSGDNLAAFAMGDALLAFSALASQSTSSILTGIDLGGQTLPPGIYRFDVAASCTGVLLLDPRSIVNPVWIFQIGSTFTMSAGSSVRFIQGYSGNVDHVYWHVGSSATFGANIFLIGNVMAYASITCGANNILNGRLIALNGAITLNNDQISAPITISTLPPPIVVSNEDYDDIADISQNELNAIIYHITADFTSINNYPNGGITSNHSHRNISNIATIAQVQKQGRVTIYHITASFVTVNNFPNYTTYKIDGKEYD